MLDERTVVQKGHTGSGGITGIWRTNNNSRKYY